MESALRYIECLQVGKENVVIEVRPAFSAIGADTVTNKWMEPRHWEELYAILLKVADAHIKSSGKCYQSRRADSSLLTVWYQFERNAKYYKDLLGTYDCHPDIPILPLTDSGGYTGPEPYPYALVASVAPLEADVPSSGWFTRTRLDTVTMDTSDDDSSSPPASLLEYLGLVKTTTRKKKLVPVPNLLSAEKDIVEADTTSTERMSNQLAAEEDNMEADTTLADVPSSGWTPDTVTMDTSEDDSCASESSPPSSLLEFLGLVNTTTRKRKLVRNQPSAKKDIVEPTYDWTTTESDESDDDNNESKRTYIKFKSERNPSAD